MLLDGECELRTGWMRSVPDVRPNSPVFLGFWQLSRGQEKQALLETYAERRAAEPMSSAQLQATSVGAIPGRKGFMALPQRSVLRWLY